MEAMLKTCRAPASLHALALLLAFFSLLLLPGGCVQTGTPVVRLNFGAPNTSISLMPPASNLVPNASAPLNTSDGLNSSLPDFVNSSLLNSSSNSSTEQAAGQLLDLNQLFLDQTQAASDAAGRLNFDDAARLYNLSSQSAIRLTTQLSKVCGLKGVNCTSQLDGYAQISLCARQRAVFYWQVQTLMP